MSAERHTPSNDPAVPPGWNYNPSAWSERLPMFALALLGFGIALYLALYQLGVFTTVWEPFFGDGSRAILHSSVSRLLPVPDAALGAVGYLLDIGADLIGGRVRWRARPWIVICFSLVVCGMGAASVTLVILQPVLFGAWCTLCLTSATISVAIVGPAMDELLASLQLLKREHAKGRSTWAAFWGIRSATAA